MLRSPVNANRATQIISNTTDEKPIHNLVPIFMLLIINPPIILVCRLSPRTAIVPSFTPSVG
jgi:hypothetical protein